eukprot:Rhum_TRINITY_DN2626_c0_g1::Rhum_TRINITY_DN2626_c0_g1_i1::g.7768::m.7768
MKCELRCYFLLLACFLLLGVCLIFLTLRIREVNAVHRRLSREREQEREAKKEARRSLLLGALATTSGSSAAAAAAAPTGSSPDAATVLLQPLPVAPQPDRPDGCADITMENVSVLTTKAVVTDQKPVVTTVAVE